MGEWGSIKTLTVKKDALNNIKDGDTILVKKN